MTYALPSWRLSVFPKTLDNQFDTCEFAQLCRLNTSRKLVDFMTNASFPGPIKSIG